MNESSKLLINESPLQVLPSLALILGESRAIILQQIQYLLTQKKGGMLYKDGQKYIWNTANEFHRDYFIFMPVDTIRKHLKKLESEGYLIVIQARQHLGDMTKFYRIDYEFLDLQYAAMPDHVANCATCQPAKNAECNRQKMPVPHVAKIAGSLNESSKDKNSIQDIKDTPGDASAVVQKDLSPHQLLMKHHADRIGKISDGKAQGGAAKWLLENSYSAEDSIACYEFQLTQLKNREKGWRTKVSWLTVKSDIGDWVHLGYPRSADKIKQVRPNPGSHRLPGETAEDEFARWKREEEKYAEEEANEITYLNRIKDKITEGMPCTPRDLYETVTAYTGGSPILWSMASAERHHPQNHIYNVLGALFDKEFWDAYTEIDRANWEEL